MSTEINRIYNVKDDRLIVLAGVARDHFIKYQHFFTSFNDVVFPVDYHDTTLKVHLDDAKNTISDAFFVKRQRKETDDVAKKKESTLVLLKNLSFNVKSTFGNKPIILEKFMLKHLSDKSQNVDSFIGYLKDVVNTALEFKTELLAGGMKENLIEMISEAGDELDKERREQIEVMKSRPGITNDRITKMNTLWRDLVNISEAADVIFFANPDIKALFDLPKPNKSSNSEEEEQEESSEEGSAE